MKIYHLYATVDWGCSGYGTTRGHIVIAPDEESARRLAQENAGWETDRWDRAWLDPAVTVCEELTPGAEARHILSASGY